MMLIRSFVGVLFLFPTICLAQRSPEQCAPNFINTPTTRTTLTRANPDAPYTNYFGGGIIMRCRGQKNELRADSAEWFGDRRLVHLVGRVRYTEPGVRINADTMYYYQDEARLRAVGNVFASNDSGSTMNGPSAEYFRETPRRKLSRLIAPGRPKLVLLDRDSASRRQPIPAEIVADRIVMDGKVFVYASGKVTLTRPDINAGGDSVFMDRTKDQSRLMREPFIEGTQGRKYRLTGGIIDLFSKQKELERVVATPAGHVTSEDLELISDSIDLRIQRRQLNRAMAWGPSRARATSLEHNIEADSIDAHLPNQKIESFYAVGNAYATSLPDSTIQTSDRNWLRGRRIVARFDTAAPPPDTSQRIASAVRVPDSVARAKRDTASRPRIREIVASGKASTFYQIADPHPAAARNKPQIGYMSNAGKITMTFRGMRRTISNVVASPPDSGKVQGVFLRDTAATATQSKSSAKDSAKKDSAKTAKSKKASGKGKGASSVGKTK
jgi:hypothetical protein